MVSMVLGDLNSDLISRPTSVYISSLYLGSGHQWPSSSLYEYHAPFGIDVVHLSVMFLPLTTPLTWLLL